MPGNFKLKAQTIQAIDIGDPVVQASEVASLIGATSFTTDLSEYSVTFFLTDSNPMKVKAGNVVSMIEGEAAVQDAEAFYDKYEPAFPPI